MVSTVSILAVLTADLHPCSAKWQRVKKVRLETEIHTDRITPDRPNLAHFWIQSVPNAVSQIFSSEYKRGFQQGATLHALQILLDLDADKMATPADRITAHTVLVDNLESRRHPHKSAEIDSISQPKPHNVGEASPLGASSIVSG